MESNSCFLIWCKFFMKIVEKSTNVNCSLIWTSRIIAMHLSWSIYVYKSLKMAFIFKLLVGTYASKVLRSLIFHLINCNFFIGYVIFWFNAKGLLDVSAILQDTARNNSGREVRSVFLMVIRMKD